MSGKSYRLFYFISILFISSNIYSQHQISIKPTLGGYIYNSENSKKIMGNKNYFLNYGFEINYENKNLFEYDIQVDYSFVYSGINDVLEFLRTGSDGPDPIATFYSDVSLSLNNFDISLRDNLSEYFSYGIGPSFSIVNRSYKVKYYDLLDKLSSFAVGVNTSINFKYPFSKDEQYLFLIGSLKLRYLYGLFYDKGLRDLSNYNQHFVTGNFSIGLGYSF